jgi:hypothetical protein
VAGFKGAIRSYQIDERLLGGIGVIEPKDKAGRLQQSEIEKRIAQMPATLLDERRTTAENFTAATDYLFMPEHPTSLDGAVHRKLLETLWAQGRGVANEELTMSPATAAELSLLGALLNGPSNKKGGRASRIRHDDVLLSVAVAQDGEEKDTALAAMDDLLRMMYVGDNGKPITNMWDRVNNRVANLMDEAVPSPQGLDQVSPIYASVLAQVGREIGDMSSPLYPHLKVVPDVA